MPSRTFYVKPFNNDILKRLMAFSRFLGETGEGAQFVIDLERARTNGVRMEEIRRVLGELGVSLDTETLEQLEHEMPEYDVLFELKDENLVLNPRVRISDILRKYRINIPYDSVSKVYRTRPFYYYILKKILEDEGLRVKKLDLQFERFSMGLNVELRSYQVEAIKAWKNNGFRGVIALPTGAGKTLIGIEGMSEVGSSTLVVTFTNEQLKQWAENIIKYTNGTPEVGLYYSKKKELAPITITTYQTAIRHMAELSRFNLLIIDEAHHLPAEKFREIALSCIAPYRMALSATPYRSDGKHVELFRLMGGLVYQRGIEELVAQGYLAKFKIVRIKTPLTTEERAQYDMLMKKFRSLSNGRPILEVVKKAREGDGRALEAMRVYSKLRYLVGLTKAKLSKIIEIIEKEKGKKVIIFFLNM